MNSIHPIESHAASQRLPLIALMVVGTILVLGLIQLSGQSFAADDSSGYEVTLRNGFQR